MSRSIAIGAALFCALGGAVTAQAQPLGDNWRVEITVGGRLGSERELARAEARLRAAERAFTDARCKLDELLAQRESLRRELAILERKIADCRDSGKLHELHRLEERLAQVRHDAGRIDAEFSRYRNLAAEAGRAADAARSEYFRQAECSPPVLDARQRISYAERDLEAARGHALERLYATLEWQREASWRDDISRRLDAAERYRSGRYEVDKLRRELAESDRRLKAMEAEAIACDLGVRDAEARLAAAQRAHDELWACVERDLAHDRAYASASADRHRFEQEAARAEEALLGTRDLMARLEQDIDRLHGAHYIADTRGLEEQAAAVRYRLNCLVGELRTADECLRRAEHELASARRDYEIALAACRIAFDDRGHDRGYDRPDYRPDRRPDPRPDPRRDDRGGYDRDDRGRDDDRRAQDERSRGDDRARQQERQAQDDSKGTYRDRGERYERARGGDGGGEDARRRTRD